MLYVHIPYCEGKCIYCDFYSGGNPQWEELEKALTGELKERIGELSGKTLSSVYFGGGTPSLMPTDVFLKLCEGIRTVLESAGITMEQDAEQTIEVNPEDVTEEKAAAWKAAGINRVSIGIQSLDDRELRNVRRRHNAEKAEIALEILKRHFNNISVDIIFGLPGQDTDSLSRTLEKITRRGPQHISAYALTFEEGTALEVLARRGEIHEPTDEEYRALGELLDRKLTEAGYERYEISNYALPGYESRHNSGYWDGKAYLGIGPSAASFDGVNVRRTNKADIRGYLERFRNEGGANTQFYEEEVLSDEERCEEIIFLSLRTAKGVDLGEIERRFGSERARRLREESAKWIDAGYMEEKGGRLRLSPKGVWISDRIMGDLL